MKIINTYVKLQDDFSGAYLTKVVTQSVDKHNKMLAGVGKVLNQFDTVNQIHYHWAVLEVREATQEECNINGH